MTGARTAAPPVHIAGLGLWLPGHATAASWATRTPDPAVTTPRGLALDRTNRRRASLLGRALADAVAEAIGEAGVNAATIPIVIGSAIGEVATMLSVLDQMWRLHTPVSPAAFSVSVHNAASGLISISNKNRGFTTSIAADDNTPAAALLEGIGLVCATGGPVVVACGDEGAPADLVPDARRWGLLAVALVLVPEHHAGAARARLRVTLGNAPPVAATAAAESALAQHPQVGLLDLADAVLRGAPARIRLDRGRGAGWCADIEVPDPR